MKILWQVHESNISGANICLLEYLEILQNKGFEQHIIVPGLGSMLDELKKNFFDVSIIPSYLWVANPLVKDKVSTRLRKVIRQKIAVTATSNLIENFNPDYVATNTIANPVAAYAAKNKGIKHIWFIHEFGEEDHGYTIAGNANKGKQIINKLSEKIVFNSEIIKKQYLNFTESTKRFIVHNATNVPKIKIINEFSKEKLKLIMLGQIAASKNQLDALKAIKLCIEKGLDLVLNIAGKTENQEYLHNLKNYIAYNNLKNFVNFIGTTNHPEDLLIKHDALLMCSRMEAFGRVTVEANKCGLPVIAANTGGSVELITENENGYLYESGNFEDLAKNIIKFSKDKASFNRKKIASEAWAKFNFINTGKELLQVFN